MSELQGLQSRIQAFRDLGANVVAISVDSVEQNAEMAKSRGFDYAILSDADHRAMRAFGLVHAGAFQGEDIARPATFVIDRGAIRWRDLTSNYRVRPTADEVLEAVRGVLAQRG